MTIGLRILHQSKSVLAVYKPPMISISTPYDIENLLAPLLGTKPTLYNVHRLDKDTTGVLVFALSPTIAKSLMKQWQDHTVKKEYIAIARGNPGMKGLVSDRLLVGDRQSEVSVQGVEARTEWEVLAYNRQHQLSLMRLTPQTGRKHQIRVHLATSLNTPVLGDKRYSHQTKAFEQARNHDGFKFGPGVYAPPHRMFLHARKLEFDIWERAKDLNPARLEAGLHPLTKAVKKRIEIEALIPPDFAKLCNSLFGDWEDKVGERRKSRLKSGVPIHESSNMQHDHIQ